MDEEKCCVCLAIFSKSWELQNPFYCCSAKYCSECSKKLDSCPQCRNCENILLTPNEKMQLDFIKTMELTIEPHEMDGQLGLEMTEEVFWESIFLNNLSYRPGSEVTDGTLVLNFRTKSNQILVVRYYPTPHGWDNPPVSVMFA